MNLEVGTVISDVVVMAVNDGVFILEWTDDDGRTWRMAASGLAAVGPENLQE